MRVWHRDMPDDMTEPLLRSNVESARFKVFNRVAATRPIGDVLALLDGPTIVKPTTGAADETPSTQEGADVVQAYLRVVVVKLPAVFGIRIAIHVGDDDHVFIVDASIEYTWKQNIQNYSESGIGAFIRTDAAPRIAVAAWTVLEELARSVETDIAGAIELPIDAIAEAAINQALGAEDHRNVAESG